MPTRTKSSVLRCLHDRLQPVVTGETSAHLHTEAAHGQVELVVHDHDPAAGSSTLWRRTSLPTASPERFMYVRGNATRCRLSPQSTSATSAFSFDRFSERAGALGEQRDDFSAEVVRLRFVLLGPGCPTDDEQVG